MIVLNNKNYIEQPLPILNKQYDYFDDGKINRTRHGECVILEVIPFSEITPEVLDIWKKESTECYWLFNPTTDYFVKTTDENDNEEEMYFVRTLDGGWFSLGYWASRLDIDGSLVELMEKYERGEY